MTAPRRTAGAAWLIAAMGAWLTVARPAPAFAQDETRLGAEFRREAEDLKENCADISRITGCVMTVATGHPLHVAFGSIAPGNGVALGAAFGTSEAPSESWRVTWSGDGVATFGGSWRAGAYARFIHTPSDTITVVTTPEAATEPIGIRSDAVIGLYAQATSLQRVNFFGLGPHSSRDQRSVFGFTQSVIGVNGIMPVDRGRLLRQVRLALVGEAAGRFITLRDGVDDEAAPTSVVFDDAEAPGQRARAGFLHLGQGVRLSPSLAGDHLRLNYLVMAQEFFTGSAGVSSFRRTRVDLRHEIPLFGHSGAGARDFNSPNDCAAGPGGSRCPAISRDRHGTITARVLFVASTAGAGRQVPFVFQPTLGGSDVNGQAALASYDDGRFRAPNLLLFQQSLELSVWRMIGAFFQADQGTVALTRGDLASALAHSVTIGVTVRAGGFPMMVVSWAAGGPEGRHISATINTSLLGGSSRPPLD